MREKLNINTRNSKVHSAKQFFSYSSLLLVLKLAVRMTDCREVRLGEGDGFNPRHSPTQHFLCKN